jgi:uncharacterized protein YjbJ (UPF0337 family)
VFVNRDILAGKWKQLKGEARRQWGRLTDDELDQAGGNAEKLVGLLQERYGIARQEAERQLDEFLERSGAHAEEPEPAGHGRR